MRQNFSAPCARVWRVAARPVAPAAGAEQVHLTWFMWSGTEPEVVAWKHVAELVTQKYPDITVEFQTTSFPGLLDQAAGAGGGLSCPTSSACKACARRASPT